MENSVAVLAHNIKGGMNACIHIPPFIMCVKSQSDFHINSGSIWRQHTLIEIDDISDFYKRSDIYVDNVRVLFYTLIKYKMIRR